MDQEYLTSAEQGQLGQEIIPKTQGEKEIQTGQDAAENTREENWQSSDAFRQQQKTHREEKSLQEIEAQEGDAPPDPQKDFMGYMQWLGKTLHKQELLRTKQQQTPPALEAEQLRSFYQSSVTAIKQKHHDFDQAADFIYDMRAKQLAAFSSIYPEMADQKVVDTVIGHELKQILQECARKNQNPAEVIYTIAQNIGYTKSQSNMAENFQEKHNSARTLAASNGLLPSDPISLDMLNKMSEAEFGIWVSDPKNKAAFKRLMRGGHG
ncbi:hypothetical protein [Bartonella sp. CB175]|uniref:hypothetical protein n=1 Tax=Bartonella sp. CB175 TaxID=3112256 RepID=UPI00300E0546